MFDAKDVKSLRLFRVSEGKLVESGDPRTGSLHKPNRHLAMTAMVRNENTNIFMSCTNLCFYVVVNIRDGNINWRLIIWSRVLGGRMSLGAGFNFSLGAGFPRIRCHDGSGIRKWRLKGSEVNAKYKKILKEDAMPLQGLHG